MTTEIDVSGYDMAETLAKDRRRRSEAALSEGMTELDALLLPLTLAVARLSARMRMAEATQ
ncbi:MAG: hypothetical protein K5831_08635 [Brevundimonas sp.]|jgi:hypothetical protein|uniref:hypothetical protein n=1 Tax=Brevundimonas sp. TaxID=1871086 RepID=UPI00258CF48D|nr:hypothetical protein [Brevundimonas sp.]MCV0414937.1 hypothetical protein [Brevundimonas sp.]